MITVKIIYHSSGQPAEGAGVAISFSSLFRGITDTEYTNERGEAYFDAEPDDGQVFVNGSTEYEGEVRGRVVIYI